MIRRLFKNIKEYFNSIFNSQKVNLLEEAKTVENNTEFKINDSEEKNEFDTFIENEKEKKDFFLIYENVKNGVIKLEELMIDDLIKVQLMLKSELKCINEEIDISESELNSIKYKIITSEKENKMYYSKLKNKKNSN